MKTLIKSSVSLLFLVIFLVFAAGSSDDDKASSDEVSSNGPEGVYYVGPSKDNSSYISFSPPNKHHSDFITWTGNKRNGNRNCATKGSYTYDKDSKTIKVSGFYNSNCGSISDRNGTWKVEGDVIVSPGGVRWRK